MTPRWVIAPLVLGGCALITDLGPLSSDAGSSTDSGITDGAAGDAPTIDVVQEAGAGTFACKPAPSGTIACEDWEAVTAPCQALGGALPYGGATGQIDPTHAVSPTHAAAFAAPVISTGIGSYACLLTQADQTQSTLSVSFALRVNGVDTSARTPVARVSYDDNIFQVMVLNGNLVLDVGQPASDGGTIFDDYTFGTYQVGEWTAIRFDLATTPSISGTVWVASLKQGELEPAPTSTTGWSQAFFKTFPLPAPTSNARGASVGLLPIENTTVATDLEIDNYLLRTF